jgi:hypothetical protein
MNDSIEYIILVNTLNEKIALLSKELDLSRKREEALLIDRNNRDLVSSQLLING